MWRIQRVWDVWQRGGERIPWRLGIAEDGGEAIGYLIAFVVIVMVVGAIIAAIISVGVFLLGGLALAGTSWGLVMALRDFIATLIDAHRKIK